MLKPKLKNIIKEITPPIILRGSKAVFLSGGKEYALEEAEGEKGPAWYDTAFEKTSHWRFHYTQAQHYFLWAVIVDRIVRAGVQSVLEIGCGPGQLACLIRDKKISKYHGFDFSPKRIKQAKRVCPEFTFSVEDAYETDLFATYDYDAVICTEFLEHLEEDVEVINRIRSGARFYGTVPNFLYTSHVRHFRNETEVLSRYEQCFRDFRVDTFLGDAEGRTFYLMEGRKL